MWRGTGLRAGEEGWWARGSSITVMRRCPETEYPEGPSGQEEDAGDSWLAAGREGMRVRMPLEKLASRARRILCALASSRARRRDFVENTDGIFPWDGRSREDAESQAQKVSESRILRDRWSRLRSCSCHSRPHIGCSFKFRIDEWGRARGSYGSCRGTTMHGIASSLRLAFQRRSAGKTAQSGCRTTRALVNVCLCATLTNLN